jgi:DHA1 family purine ribonucleoside efflux pump-like MFS transporter
MFQHGDAARQNPPGSDPDTDGEQSQVRVPETTSSAKVPDTEIDKAPDTETERTSWFGVFALALGVFALVMAEFLPTSLLPDIARDLGISEGAAGQAVTVTALAAGVTGLLLPAALPRMDRRIVVVALTVVALVANIIVAVAPNQLVLLLARVFSGVALGGFWAIALSMTAQLSSPRQLSRALAVVNSGISVATVVAIPLGSWLGGVWGWRAVFVLGAGIALLAALTQAVTLPRFPSQARVGARALLTTLRSTRLIIGLIGMLILIGGHIAGYTYIVPAAERGAGLDASAVAVLLLCYGLANVAGVAFSGVVTDRMFRVATFGFPLVLAVGMMILAWSGPLGTPFVAAALWGFGFGAVPTITQTWSARVAPDRLEHIGGIGVAVFQGAIALGAAIGGLLVDGTSTTVAILVGASATIVGATVLTVLAPRNATTR